MYLMKKTIFSKECTNNPTHFTENSMGAKVTSMSPTRLHKPLFTNLRFVCKCTLNSF